MNDNLNIEELFKNKFESFELKPSHNIWNNISKKKRINDFLKFIPGKFNIYYLITSIIVISGVVLLNSNNSSQNYNEVKNIDPETETVIYDNNNSTSETELKDHKTIESVIPKNSKIDHNETVSVESNIENIELVDKNISKEELEKEESNFKLEDIKIDNNNNQAKSIKFSPSFISDVEQGCAPLTVSFKNKTKCTNDFIWSFGDNQKSLLTNPTIVYENPGTYEVILIAKYEGTERILKKSITVYEKPTADFMISNQNNLFARNEISFANVSGNYHKCKWIFGDNTYSDQRHPTHTYKNKGIFDVKLIAYSENGCIDSTQERSLYIDDSKYKIRKPTAFTPNIYGENDGYWQANNNNNNDIFHLVFSYEVAEYDLIIMNRWGTIVFKSNDVKKGWNGYYRNALSPYGVYVWKCSGKFIDGEVFYDTGNITLLHLNR